MTPRSTSLNAERRRRDLDALADDPRVDVLVVGAGATGAGTALDAASRGLSVVLVDRHDLAYGTSRFSSKLVHGGLRYLASGDIGVAYESARERDRIMRVNAPHLARALPMMLPLHATVGAGQEALVRAGFLMGDALRAAAGTTSAVLPGSRRLNATQTARLLPEVAGAGLRGGLLSFDGQLTDDARLVVALARTAAGYGARVLTRCAAERVTGDGATLLDRRTGRRLELRARVVVNAAGAHAGEVVPHVRLRPSRGTHVLLDAAALGTPRAALTVPVPGTRNRFVFALPQREGGVLVGLTDEAVSGPIPDVAEAPERDIAFLLDTLNTALRVRLSRRDVRGAYAGLRPLLDGGAGASADLSRRHAVLTRPEGVVTVVGGKLTTYRRMAEDAVDTALARSGLTAGPCRTRRLPLVGAAGPATLAGIAAPRRIVARYGTEALRVLAEAADTPALLEPVAGPVTGAELRYAVRHEGALDQSDLLDRRTRIGVIPDDRAAAWTAATAALEEAGPAGERPA